MSFIVREGQKEILIEQLKAFIKVILGGKLMKRGDLIKYIYSLEEENE